MENKIIINGINFQNILDLNLSIEEYGLLMFILQTNTFEFNEIKKYFKQDEIQETLKRLVQNNKVKLDIMQNNGLVIWEIGLKDEINTGSTKMEQTKSPRNALIKQSFNLKEDLLPHIIVENDENTIRNILNYINVNKDKYERANQIVIKNENDYENYLKASSPITLLLENNANLNLQLITCLFDQIINKEKEYQLLNLAIDYCISTSYYNSFTFKFFEMILLTWDKANIRTFEQGLKFIKEIKSKKAQGNYVEEDWSIEAEKQEENINEKYEEIKNVDLEKLLKEKGML